MSGLNFMRASLALCYFYNLPSSITEYLFSVEFLEKLDDELKHCYAKVIFIFLFNCLNGLVNLVVIYQYTFSRHIVYEVWNVCIKHKLL